TEARTAAGTDVVLVAVGLQDLAGELLTDLGGVPAHDRLTLGSRRLRPRLCRADLSAIADGEALCAVQHRLSELVEVVLRRQRCGRETGRFVQDYDAGVVPVGQIGEVA